MRFNFGNSVFKTRKYAVKIFSEIVNFLEDRLTLFHNYFALETAFSNKAMLVIINYNVRVEFLKLFTKHDVQKLKTDIFT